MRVLKRVRHLITANVNDLIDRAENPKVMANQMIRDMEEGFTELRDAVAATIANARLLERRIGRMEEEERQWLENAETAVKVQDDALAKKALAKKRTLTQSIQGLRGQHAKALELMEKMKAELLQVENKLYEARAKRDALVARLTAAAARERLYASSLRIRSRLHATFDAVGAHFEHDNWTAAYEERLERNVLELEAHEEITSQDLVWQFNRINQERDLESELNALKSKFLPATSEG